jgi:hypothetical protein
MDIDEPWADHELISIDLADAASIEPFGDSHDAAACNSDVGPIPR